MSTGATIMVGVALLIPLAMLGLLIHELTGYNPLWFFRSRHDRDIGMLLRGALVMGPEGFEREGELSYRLKVGDIKVWLPYGGSYKPTFRVGGKNVTLACRRDRVILAQSIRRWERSYKRRARRERQRAELDHVTAHIQQHRDKIDSLDLHIARERYKDRHPR